MLVGRPVTNIALSEEDRLKLKVLARPQRANSIALRARIILACAEGLTDSQVARRLKITLPTVGKWRRRFATQRLAGLSDAPRPGQPRKITTAKIEQVLARTRGKPPRNATRWSTRSMARAEGLTQNAVLRIWRAFGLKPHLRKP